MPEIVFESLDKVPEGLREHAKEEEGKVKVNVVPKNKLDEFRETNIKLAQERDSLKSAFDIPSSSAICSINLLSLKRASE